MRKSFGVFLFLVFLLFNPAYQESASAHHKELVLGESTASSQLVFPPVTAGPGFILPDSPLFFLDQVFQAVRLVSALDAQSKAKVRAQIAGERLAELRVMLTRNSEQGTTTALTQLTKEADMAAKALSEAAASGQDVSLLARQLNETIKTQRQVLGSLENQTRGTLRLELKAARRALKEAKVEVEDELPEGELEKEIEENLHDEIEEEVEEADDSVQELERSLEELNRQASEAGRKALKRREEALKKAIEERNEQLRKNQERLLEAEKKKQGELLRVQKTAASEARKAVEEAQKAAKRFQQAQEKAFEIKNQPVDSSVSDSNSSGSGSGSSSSDSSGSNSSGSEDED